LRDLGLTELATPHSAHQWTSRRGKISAFEERSRASESLLEKALPEFCVMDRGAGERWGRIVTVTTDLSYLGEFFMAEMQSNQNTENPIDVVPVEESTTQNFDAEEMKAAIKEGEEDAPESVDVAADYAASKQMSTGIMDQQEAEKSVAPELQVKSADQVSIPTSSPNKAPDYMDMARDISPSPAGAGNVTDDLMEKALEKGQAAGS
jgi:hypothetical protein